MRMRQVIRIGPVLEGVTRKNNLIYCQPRKNIRGFQAHCSIAGMRPVLFVMISAMSIENSEHPR